MLEEIRSDSVWAEQRSCLPPVTSPNWKCYSTGKNPGKLGVYWWEIVDVEAREITIPDSSAYDSAELFDYLGDEGQTWAAVNMPTTFPPHGKDNNGVMISGGSAAEGRSFTSPPDLQNELESEFEYRVSPSKSIGEDGSIEEILELIDARFEVAKWLLRDRDLDFLHLTVFLCNKLHHYFWDGEPTLEAWKRIDDHLRWFADRDLDLVFMSDHGSNEIESEFQINVWLEEEGYLVREDDKKTASKVGTELGITQHQLSEFAGKLGIRDSLSRLLPDRLIDKLPKQGYKKEYKLDPIDWENTDAIASGQGLVYLTEPNAPDADDLRNEIAEELSELTDPITERPVARDVYLSEDIYSGSLEYAPDIVFDQAEGIHTEDNVGEYDLFSRPSDWRGENEPAGIFMAYGPSFRSTGQIDGTSILDLAPTILHLRGVGIPRDIDGEVLDVFNPETEPAIADPTYRDSLPKPRRDGRVDENDMTDVKDQLRELGYLN